MVRPSPCAGRQRRTARRCSSSSEAATMTPTADPPTDLLLETAAQHAIRNVPIAQPAQRLADVRQMLTDYRYESASHVIVCDGARFRGVITIEDALTAPADATAASVMDAGAPMVAPGTDQERAVWHAIRHHESALSVV